MIKGVWKKLFFNSRRGARLLATPLANENGDIQAFSAETTNVSRRAF